jgi:hypothetical protein
MLDQDKLRALLGADAHPPVSLCMAAILRN